MTASLDDPQPAPHDEGTIEASRMTLGEHLDELRVRLIRASIALVVAFVALYSFRNDVTQWIQQPYAGIRGELNDEVERVYRDLVEKDPSLESELFVRENGKLVVRETERFPRRMQSLRAGGSFVQKIRICFWLSLLIAGPYIMWEIWMFVAAGLYKAERRIVYSYFPVTIVLFMLGVVFGFMYLFPAALYFTQVDGLGVDDIGRAVEFDQYLQLLRSMTLAIGLIFQLPVVMIALARVGLVHPRTYAKYRGHTAIVALIVAAILTPPDPMTQLILAGPAIVLYEVGIWCARLAWREPQTPESDDDEPTGLTPTGAGT